ncbi:MAG: hypothetical protein ACKO3W_13460 [bacterium]
MDEPRPEAPRTTPPIYAEQVVVRPQLPQPTNPMGTWALVFSILGWTCLPLIGSVVGLILGLIAVRREPRGLAIAAIVISLVGGCIGGIVALAFVLPLLALVGIAQSGTISLGPTLGTREGEAVEQFRINQGRLPASLDEIYGIGNVPTDEFGMPLRLRVMKIEHGEQFEIQAMGDDQQWDTADARTLYSTTATTVQYPSGQTVTETTTRTGSDASAGGSGADSDGASDGENP